MTDKESLVSTSYRASLTVNNTCCLIIIDLFLWHLGRAGMAHFRFRKRELLGSSSSSSSSSWWPGDDWGRCSRLPCGPLRSASSPFLERFFLRGGKLWCMYVFLGEPLIPYRWIIDDFKYPRISFMCNIQLPGTSCWGKHTRHAQMENIGWRIAQDCGQRPWWFARTFYDTDSFQTPEQWISNSFGVTGIYYELLWKPDIKSEISTIFITNQSDRSFFLQTFSLCVARLLQLFQSHTPLCRSSWFMHQDELPPFLRLGYLGCVLELAGWWE